MAVSLTCNAVGRWCRHVVWEVNGGRQACLFTWLCLTLNSIAVVNHLLQEFGVPILAWLHLHGWGMAWNQDQFQEIWSGVLQFLWKGTQTRCFMSGLMLQLGKWSNFWSEKGTKCNSAGWLTAVCTSVYLGICPLQPVMLMIGRSGGRTLRRLPSISSWPKTTFLFTLWCSLQL